MLCAFVAMLLTTVVLFLLHSDIVFSVCSTSVSTSSSGSHYGPQVCSPQSWQWVLPSVGVVTAAVGGIGTCLLLRRQARSHDEAAPPVGQLSDCISPRRLDPWI